MRQTPKAARFEARPKRARGGHKAQTRRTHVIQGADADTGRTHGGQGGHMADARQTRGGQMAGKVWRRGESRLKGHKADARRTHDKVWRRGQSGLRRTRGGQSAERGRAHKTVDTRRTHGGRCGGAAKRPGGHLVDTWRTISGTRPEHIAASPLKAYEGNRYAGMPYKHCGLRSGAQGDSTRRAGKVQRQGQGFSGHMWTKGEADTRQTGFGGRADTGRDMADTWRTQLAEPALPDSGRTQGGRKADTWPTHCGHMADKVWRRGQGAFKANAKGRTYGGHKADACSY